MKPSASAMTSGAKELCRRVAIGLPPQHGKELLPGRKRRASDSGSCTWPSPGGRRRRGNYFHDGSVLIDQRTAGFPQRRIGAHSAGIRSLRGRARGRGAAHAAGGRYSRATVARYCFPRTRSQTCQFCSGSHRAVSGGDGCFLTPISICFFSLAIAMPSKRSKIPCAAFRKNCGTCG